jgi:hypothetical protein
MNSLRRLGRAQLMISQCKKSALWGMILEATRQVWSERTNVIGNVLKFGVSVQRVRIPSGQSVDPQAGNKPCDGVGNHGGDA